MHYQIKIYTSKKVLACGILPRRQRKDRKWLKRKKKLNHRNWCLYSALCVFISLSRCQIIESPHFYEETGFSPILQMKEISARGWFARQRHLCAQVLNSASRLYPVAGAARSLSARALETGPDDACEGPCSPSWLKITLSLRSLQLNKQSQRNRDILTQGR